eukprot:758134-Hanusia_phi.AAC.1
MSAREIQTRRVLEGTLCKIVLKPKACSEKRLEQDGLDTHILSRIQEQTLGLPLGDERRGEVESGEREQVRARVMESRVEQEDDNFPGDYVGTYGGYTTDYTNDLERRMTMHRFVTERLTLGDICVEDPWSTPSLTRTAPTLKSRGI